MTKRKAWADAQPITGADLTDIGIYQEQALGELAIATGTGRLNGLYVTQTPTASSQVVVSPGRALIFDPSVGRPRLVTLMDAHQPTLMGRSSGDYAIIMTAVERDEDLRTIVPPPPNHPFYEPGLTAYDFATAKRWVAGITIQAMPYTPTGAQVILAVVSWDGATVTNAQIKNSLDFPTPLVAKKGLRAEVISDEIAGKGLYRSEDEALNVAVDGTSVTLIKDEAKNGAFHRLSLVEGGVSDYYLGKRRMEQATPPDANVFSATPTDIMRYLAGSVARATGKSVWTQAPATTLEELNMNVTRKGQDEIITGNWTVRTPLSVAAATEDSHAVNLGIYTAGLTALRNETSDAMVLHRQAKVLDHPDGSVTDAKIGNRTVRQIKPPLEATPTNTLTAILGYLAGAVSGITGKSNWNTAPATTLEELNASAARKTSNETVTGSWSFNRPVSVGIPTSPDHAVTKQMFDAAVGNIQGSLGEGVKAHRQAKVLDHPDGSVTDAKIGARTITPSDSLPTGTVTAELNPALNIIAKTIKDMKGGSKSWYESPSITLEQISQRLSATEGAIGSIGDGSVTDGKIGLRTVDQTYNHASSTGSLTQLLSTLANRVNTIAGTTNWYDKPAASLASLSTSKASKDGAETISGDWAFSRPVAVPAPTEGGHAANKEWVTNQIAQAQLDSSGDVDVEKLLDGKADKSHTHSYSELTGTPPQPDILTEIGGFNPGRIPPRETVMGWVATRRTRLTGDGQAKALHSAASGTSFQILKNGRSVGSIHFRAGSSVGSVTFNSTVYLNTGDALTVLAPAGMDETLADVMFSFAGVYY